MGWSDERSTPLKMIGLVHDIGKISIPVEILTKPIALSPLEMALIREHVQASYDILKNVPFPIPVAEIIWQHHERIDGSGYPRGLKGDSILPEAKILGWPTRWNRCPPIGPIGPLRALMPPSRKFKTIEVNGMTRMWSMQCSVC